MDMEGDQLIKSKLIAIQHGKSNALKVSSFIFFVLVPLSFLPFKLNWLSIIHMIPIGIMDLSFAYLAVWLLKSENEEGRKFIRWIYLGAISGIIAFIVIRFTGI